MDTDRIALLTDEQRTYLALVHEGLTSKQIAQKLGGSHHTVNSKIALAVRLLGARDRDHAAIILSAGPANGSYDRSYDAPHLVQAASLEAIGGSEEMSTHRDGITLPIPTGRGQRNQLTFWERSIWILVIAAVTALLVGGLISGIIAQIDGLGGRP